MFPTADFNVFISWLRSPTLPSLEVIRAALNVAQYILGQVGSLPDGVKSSGPPMSNEECAVALESCIPTDGIKTATSVDWVSLLMTVLQILAQLRR